MTSNDVDPLGARAVVHTAEVIRARVRERDEARARGSEKMCDELHDAHDELLERLIVAQRRAREAEASQKALSDEVCALRGELASERASMSSGEGGESDAAKALRREVTEAYEKLAEGRREVMEARERASVEEAAREEAERALGSLGEAKERLERRLREAETALAAARKSEAQALDEAESQSAMKNAALGRLDQLEKENQELLERLMEMKTREAERMNEINDLYADLMRQKKNAELNAKAESLAEASAASMKALSLSSMMANPIPSKKRHILQSNKGGTHRVALSHDGFTAACAGEDKVVALFDTNTGARTSELVGCMGAILDVSFSADDSLVLGASTDCSIQLWDTLTGRVKHRLTGHVQKVTSAQISQMDSKRAISCSQDRSLKTWDLVRGLATGSMLTASNVHSVTFDSSEQHAVSGHFDGSVRIWDLRANQVERENKFHASPITAIIVMPNQNELLTNSRDNSLKLIDIRRMDVVRSFSAPNYRVGTDWSSPCVAPDGQHIASGGSDGGLLIWRVNDGRLMTTLHGHDAVIATCSWNAAGTLASACKNGVCILWE